MFAPQDLNIRLPFPVHRFDTLIRYLCALAATGVACLGTYFLWSFINPTVSLLFFIAVLFSAWFCGTRPAIVCCILSTLACNYLFISPMQSFSLAADDLLRLSVFMMAAVFVSSLTMARAQAEEVTKRMEKQLAVTLKSIGEAIITVDAKARVVSMNSVAQSLTGWTESEARGRNLREVFQILDHQTREPVEGVIGSVMRNNAVIALGAPVLMLTREGLEISITEIATPLRDHQGQTKGVVLVLKDAAAPSVQKTDAQVLLEKLSLLGSIDVPMFALDQQGKCLFITKAATTMLGYHSEELIGREIHEIIRTGSSDANDEDDGGVQLFGDVSANAITGVLMRRDGASTPVELSIAPILIGDSLSGTVVTISDLTQHNRAEDAVLALETIVDSIEEAVVMHTPDGVITQWSISAERLFGYSADEVTGRHISIIHVPGRQRELNDLFKKVLRREAIEPFETARTGKGGEQIDVCIRVAPLTSSTGEVIGVFQIIKDIRNERSHPAEPIKSTAFRSIRQHEPPSSPVQRFVDRDEKALRPSRLTPPSSHAQSPPRPSAPAVIIGESRPMQKLFGTIERIGPTESSVLITGATGTGKELVARAIHQRSHRANGPFVDINCSAMPDTLIEAELFGHQKGTFTGAHEHRPGLFEVANGGTLFLDEVDALNLSAQAKLLRVIQERRVRRIGGRINIDVDVRIISATNTDLSVAINEARFRPDLFYRLRVVPIQVPELYQREGDVELLIEHFLKRHAEKNGGALRRFDLEARRALIDYPWPGNVRELENTIEFALAMGTGDELGLDVLPPEIAEGTALQSPKTLKQVLEAYMDESIPLAEIEKRYILSVLQQFGGNQVKTAAALGIDRSKLYRRLKQYGVRAVKFIQEEDVDGLQLLSGR